MTAQAMTTSSNEQGSLMEAIQRRGLDDTTWRALTSSVFPGAAPKSVLLAVDYCKARNLDVMKKPCHIVPMEVTDAQTGEKSYRDVILPGIYEYRTTAARTGEYLGHTRPEFGPKITFKGCFGHDLEVPEWCSMTMRRWNPEAKQIVEFPVQVYFMEVCATKDRGSKLNARWTKAPIQMLTKCTEAAGLREAFPDEIGGEPTVEEVRDSFIEGEFSVNGDKAAPGSAEAKAQSLDEQLAKGNQAPESKPEAEPASNNTPDEVSFDSTLKRIYGANSEDEIDVALDLARNLPELEVKKLSEIANGRREQLAEKANG